MHYLCVRKSKRKAPSEQMCVLLNNSIVYKGISFFLNMKCCMWSLVQIQLFNSELKQLLCTLSWVGFFVGNVITYTCWCCLYILVNITSESKCQCVIYYWKIHNIISCYMADYTCLLCVQRMHTMTRVKPASKQASIPISGDGP